MPRKRDRSFLYMAAIAGSGGVLSIGVSIGLPIYMYFHGHGFAPAIFLLSGWGVAALFGAYGCIHTYLLTDTPPPKPPRGGLSVTVLPRPTVAVAQPPESERRAA